jgi:peroxiredoxin
LQKRGGSVIAISVDSPEESRKVVEHNHLPFSILSDQDAKVITQLGLLHHAPMGHNRDIALPANFLIDKGGKVVWRYIAPYVQERVDPGEVAAEVRKLPA